MKTYFAAVGLDEFFRLYEHAAGGVVKLSRRRVDFRVFDRSIFRAI